MFEFLANVGIVEILFIPIQKAAFAWTVSIQVGQHGCQDNRILTGHTELYLGIESRFENITIERNHVGSKQDIRDSVANPIPLQLCTRGKETG